MTNGRPLPPALAAHLGAESLTQLWDGLRRRLERNGHAIRGTIEIDLGDDAADRLAGLVGRPVSPGPNRLKLTELDSALRGSSAARGLSSVVAAVTGSPLRDLPAERSSSRDRWQQVWQGLDDSLLRAGLAAHDWVSVWLTWLHGSGALTRLGVDSAEQTLRAAVAALAELAPALRRGATAAGGPLRPLGELAFRCTGTAHGLNDDRVVATLVLRAAAIATGADPVASAAERRMLWQQLGVVPDAVSGTVLTWALRPPGEDRWSAMMRERADQGLVTHLTVHELRRTDVPLAPAGQVVHGCENPQVLQAAADGGVTSPLICVSGNPSGAGLLLLSRLAMRYHGDFDWPGIAIARRILALRAEPWRMSAGDYRDALRDLPVHARLGLAGPPERTPWDEQLSVDMAAADVAVHEEAVIAVLLADLV